MYNKNIANFSIDTNKYNWLYQNLWDEKQIQYFYDNQFILPSTFKKTPFIRQRLKDRFSNKTSSNTWILSYKRYLDINTDPNSYTNLDTAKDIKGFITVRSTLGIYNRLELFYKFTDDLSDQKDIEDIFYLMISALFIVYSADTIEIISPTSLSPTPLDESCFDTIQKLAIPKERFLVSNYLLNTNMTYTLTSNIWKEFRKDDEKRLFYLKSPNKNKK